MVHGRQCRSTENNTGSAPRQPGQPLLGRVLPHGATVALHGVRLHGVTVHHTSRRTGRPQRSEVACNPHEHPEGCAQECKRRTRLDLE